MQLTDKDLLQKHRLFSRLSGQIVWYLFEERGYAPDNIEGFMLRFEDLKAETAALLRALRDPANRGGVLVFESVAEEGSPCAACRGLVGAAIALDDPELDAWLPPFSLGCRLRGRVIFAAGRGPTHRPPDSALVRPVHRLACDDEWFFHRPWPLREVTNASS